MDATALLHGYKPIVKFNPCVYPCTCEPSHVGWLSPKGEIVTHEEAIDVLLAKMKEPEYRGPVSVL